jgi:uncharacterized membrane protein
MCINARFYILYACLIMVGILLSFVVIFALGIAVILHRVINGPVPCLRNNAPIYPTEI